MKSLGGTSRPTRTPARLWRWCSTRGKGYMLEPGTELCPGCRQPIPPTPAST